MKLTTFILLICCAFLLCGCAATSPGKIAKWQSQGSKLVLCQAGKDCEIKWGRCLKWVQANSRWEIQNISDFIITTDGPFESPSSAFSIKREPNPDGTYTISFEAWCGSSFGCIPDERQLKAAFVNYVNGS